MKLLILGATGPSGLKLVEQSLEQGHEVTAFVRTPAKMKISHARLTVAKGDVLDKDSLLRALEGKDAVLSALGVGKSLRANNLMTNAMSNIIPAMNERGIKRLIFESAFGVGETLQQADLIQKIIFRTLLKGLYSDKAKAEEQLRSSALDWVLVYPVVLTNGPLTGKYQVAEKLPMKGMPKISRADVAHFMLRQLADPSYLKKGAVIMS